MPSGSVCAKICGVPKESITLWKYDHFKLPTEVGPRWALAALPPVHSRTHLKGGSADAGVVNGVPVSHPRRQAVVNNDNLIPIRK